jgi:hypothetical protein
MAVLSTKVQYFPPNNVSNPITIADWTQISINKGTEIQNNKATLVIKNSQRSGLPDGTSQHSGSDEDGFIKFEQDGIIKIWATYDEGSGLDTSSTSSDLLFVGDLIGTKSSQTPGKNPITLSFVDRTFTVLNRVWTENIESQVVPNMIQSVIRATTDHAIKPKDELFDVDGNSPPTTGGGEFEIDARLTTEGGFIADTRTDDTAFPTATMAKVFKPVHDWVKELSGIEYTNNPDERTTTGYVQKRAMLFHVDELNRFHWFYPAGGTADHFLVAGAATAISPDTNKHYIYQSEAERKSDDIVNFIIFDAGTDISGNTIQDYEYDPNAGTPIPKDSFRAYGDISLNMKDQDVQVGNLTRESFGDTVQHIIGTAFPFVPVWSLNASGTAGVGTSVNSTATYNDAFQDAAKFFGKNRARAEIQGRSNLRLQDPVRIRGSSLIGVGDLVTYTSPAAGERKVDVRVKQITHVINKVGWTTEVQFQEDEPEVQIST